MALPMNVSMQSTDNNCNEKCGYSFNYPNLVTCNVTLFDTNLFVSNISSGSSPPVTFNYNAYNVVSMDIYSPSVHMFNGNRTDGELIISHQPVTFGPNLVVCVPLIKGATSTPGGRFIADIINSSVSNLHATGDKGTVQLKDASLSSVVPKKPFFYYQSDAYDVVIYGMDNGIFIDTAVMTALQSLIKPEQKTIFPQKDYLEYNAAGPGSSAGIGEDIIWAICDAIPSDDRVEISRPKTDFTVDGLNFNINGNLLDNPYISFVLYALVVLGIAFAVNKLLTKTK
jgi:hypothetical protein